MATPTFESFDPSSYQRAPRGNARRILALARALAEVAPREASEVVDRTAGALDALIPEVEHSLTVRRRESAPTDLSHEPALDACADTLWACLRNGLEAKVSFGHPGLSIVLAKHGSRSVVAKALHEGQEQAARAQALSTRLFGSEGLSFIKHAYAEQSESMGELLRIIDEDGLADELDALLGPQLLIALRACQVEYEAMVGTRMARDDRNSGNLSHLRGKLQRAIARHCNAVLTLLDENDPDSLPRVLAALRPLDVHRSQLATGRRDNATTADDEDARGEPAEDDTTDAVA